MKDGSKELDSNLTLGRVLQVRGEWEVHKRANDSNNEHLLNSYHVSGSYQELNSYYLI